MFKKIFLGVLVGLFIFGYFYVRKQSKILNKEVLSIAFESAPRAIDPRFVTDANSFYLSDLTQCSLINFNQNGDIVPELAESFEWLDAKTLEFKLKEKILFYDERPVTAEDVRATYAFFQQKDLDQPSPLAGAFQKIERIEADHPYVRFYFTEPEISFLQNFFIGILPADLASKEKMDEPKDLVGCGAFHLEKVLPTEFILIRSDLYRIAKPPSIKTISIKIIQDESTRWAKLQKGELNFLQNGLNADRYQEIDPQDLKVQERTALNTNYLGINFRNPDLKNLQVRQAMDLAIPKQTIIDTILSGKGTVAEGILTPDSFFYGAPTQKWQHNVEQAQEHIQQYVANSGKSTLKFTLKTTNSQKRVDTALAITSYLQEIGIEVELQSLEWGRLSEDLKTGNFDLYLLNWVGFKDPDIMTYAFSSDKFPPDGPNRGHYQNAALDRLLAEAAQEPTPSKRKELYEQAQKIIRADLPYVFLWHENNVAAFHPALNGVDLYADGRLSFLKSATWDVVE